VSALQALALNILNEGVSLTFEELSRKLSLEESILNPVMHSRSCGRYKVIAKSPTGNKINTTDTFTANSNFSCNMRKIRIPMASLDSLLNTKRVEEDQLIAIEAAIVIMKARKTLQHQQLLGEVLAQHAFFNPDPRVVKQRIEALIDRGYLERSTDDASIYNVSRWSLPTSYFMSLLSLQNYLAHIDPFSNSIWLSDVVELSPWFISGVAVEIIQAKRAAETVLRFWVFNAFLR
jgi:hypothetical protein